MTDRYQPTPAMSAAEGLVERLNEAQTYGYIPAKVRHTIHDAAAEIATLRAELAGARDALGDLVKFVGRLPAKLATPEEQEAYDNAKDILTAEEVRAHLANKEQADG